MIKLIDSEEEAEKVKAKLEESLKIDPTTDKGQFSSFEINWVDWMKCYGDAKNGAITLFQQDYDNRLFFLASYNDKIKGKPQLIHENLQRIPLIRKTWRVKKVKGEEDKYITNYKFIDDPFDRRYDGKIINTLAFNFYFYRVVDDGKEYYIFSEKKLPNEYCEFEGMKIYLDDVSEVSNNLRVKKISSIFICKEAKPFVNTISPEELVNFTKENEINEEVFHDLLFCHPNGNIYDYTPDFNLLRKAQLLSGKYEGYPLHMMKMGPVGTGKTTEAEVLDFKFKEDQGILEAANSTLKSLVPSFKEKPASLGYIAKCNRIALVDEMMKMVEDALSKREHGRVMNYFGQLNMLFEQKDRMVGSGNDNSTRIKSTAKISITTNNVSGKDTISQHLSMIDTTTLSRMLIWVQDMEEIEKIYKKDGIKQFRTHRDKTAEAFSRDESNYKNIHSRGRLYVCEEQDIGNFLTIYDSCQEFLVNLDIDRCKRLFETITNLIKEPMKQVWRARGLHHTILILDGITKHRCLFKDYDSTFTPKDSDYEDLERLLIHMVETWTTNFNPNNWREGIS
jgi:hypothetical protein